MMRNKTINCSSYSASAFVKTDKRTKTQINFTKVIHFKNVTRSLIKTGGDDKSNAIIDHVFVDV